MIKNQPYRQSGNVLWFILLAVALLGFLTMVLTRGSSTTGQSANVEQDRILASQIMRYAASVESAIETMKLNGISENDISFENTVTSVDYTNGNCPDTGCRIFHVNGGGLTYQNAPAAASDDSEWIFTAANNVGTTADPIGTTASGIGNDIVMLLPNINTSLCKTINRDLGVGTAGTIPTDAGGVTTAEFTGAFPNTLNIIDGDATPFELDGKKAGCFIDTAADPDTTYFYYVVLAR